MQFKEMYTKPIDRPIDPVVKAGSEEHLANELEEYVITPEVEGHLLRFFDEYNDADATGNGVWLSGFFGSGKSHMLKILAVLLEDRVVDGKAAFDYIMPKVENNPSLLAALEQARREHPSESILFDISAVAPNQGRTEAGALLAAFIKKFNAHRGYFDGDQQHIAFLEYDLDRTGQLDSFRKAVLEETGKPWEEVRKSAAIYTTKIDRAFDVAAGNSVGTTSNIVRYYKDSYQPSIESFAKQVAEYIQSKEKPGYRLNFFVDEIGQFIAPDDRMKLDLQTIAVELNTHCKGQSWVLVTSQENVEAVVGQMDARSANDFSKIQARFKVKIGLSSQDAKTVIQQRLLAKTSEALPLLDDMYERYRDDFRVLFDFADGSKSYKTYTDNEDFNNTYPFVPYQFDLFITAMRGLSDYNAFTGRHHSTGARSMLGVFQDVAIRIANGHAGLPPATIEEESLASFDFMFEGLKNSLKTEVYGQITLAENQLDDKMAIRVLKALLLVKYCKDFKATVGNLRILLYGSFRENTSQLEAKVKDALSLLERQVYIRRNNNVYEYLTDEEKDIEKEIRNTQISVSDIEETINDLLKDIVGAMKVTYKNGNFEHSYSFNLKIDGNSRGMQRCDLSIDLITDTPVNNGMLDLPPASPRTLSIALREADAFIREVRIYKQTEKYASVHSTTGEVREAILTGKRTANQELYIKLRNQLEELLGNSAYNASGVDITERISGSGKDAVHAGMIELITRTYTNLQQITEHFTDSVIYSNCLARQTALDTEKDYLPEYVRTVKSRIGLLSSKGSVTIGGEGEGSLISVFSKGEFGWPDEVVRNAIAILYSKKKIEIRLAGSLLEETELAEALKKNKNMGQLVVSSIRETDAETLSIIASKYREIVGTSPVENSPKTIANDLCNYLSSQIRDLSASKIQADDYPFGKQFQEQLKVIEHAYEHLTTDWNWITTSFPTEADKISSSLKELTDMTKFINGSPAQKKWKAIQDFASKATAQVSALGIENNLPQGIIEKANQVARDLNCYKLSEIAKVSADVLRANEAIIEATSKLKEEQISAIMARQSEFEKMEEFSKLNEIAKSRVTKTVEDAIACVKKEDDIRNMRYVLDNMTKKIATIMSPQESEASSQAQEAKGDDVNEPVTPHQSAGVQTVSVKDIASKAGTKPILKTQEEVEDYISDFRFALIDEINSGKIITK